MPRILLIEDDQTLRRALRIALERTGLAIAEAGDGREGLSLFRKQNFDLVITDLIMPEMEGMETIRALRTLSPQLLIIAISGGGKGSAENYLNLAQHFGANLAFAKPFELDALCGAVAQLLAGKGATESRPPIG